MNENLFEKLHHARHLIAGLLTLTTTARTPALLA